MTALFVFCGIIFLVALIIFKVSKNFLKAMFVSLIGGFGAICAVSAISYFLPLSIGINWLTLFISGLFSVPGVILILLMNVFIL